MTLNRGQRQTASAGARPPAANTLAAALAAALAAGAAENVQAAPCPWSPPATMQLEIVRAPLMEDFTRSATALTREAKPGTASANGQLVLGLERAQAIATFRISAQVSRLADGVYCAAPASITGKFGFQAMTVAVARELPQGSCIFKEVLAHEMRHVAADLETLAEFAPVARQRMEEAAARGGPVRGVAQAQVVAALDARLKAAMTAAVNDFSRRRDQRQAAIDTKAEYDRVARACHGEVARYLGPGAKGGHF